MFASRSKDLSFLVAAAAAWYCLSVHAHDAPSLEPSGDDPQRGGFRIGGGSPEEVRWAVPIQRERANIETIRESRGTNHPDVARALSRLARFQLLAVRYPEAKATFESALAAHEVSLGPEHPETAQAHADMGRMWRALGQYADARKQFERAHAIVSKTFGPDHPSTAEMEVGLSLALSDAGDYPGALALAEHAARIQEDAYKVMNCTVATTHARMAHIHGAMGHPGKALAILERVIKLGLEHRFVPNAMDNLCLANRYVDLAVVHSLTGEYGKALELYEQAARLHAVALGPGTLAAAGSASSKSSLYLALGQNERAVESAREGLSVTERRLGPDHPATASALKELARALDESGKPGEAELLLVRSLAINERAHGVGHHATAEGLIQLSRVRSRQGRGNSARELADRAVAIETAVHGLGHPATAIAHLAAVAANLAAGDQAKAHGHAEAAYLATRGSSSLPSRALAEQAMADALAARDERGAAILVGKQAVNTLQEVRSASRRLDEGLRRSLAIKGSGAYRRLADRLVEEGRLPEAQQILSMLKEDELHDFIRRTDTGDPRTTRAALTGAEEKAGAQLDGASRGLAANAREYEALRRRVVLKVGDATDEARLAQLEGELVRGRRDFDAALGTISRELATMRPQRAAEVGEKGLANLRALQGTLRSLGDGTVLVTYVSLERELMILVTTPEAQIARRSPIASADLNRAVQLHRAALQDPRSDPKVQGRILYRHLVEPIADDLRAANARTVMLSLDGSLRYLPFAALHDGERFLVERYPLTVHTEAARDKLKDQASGEWRLAAMGATRERPGFVALPSVRDELRAIVRTDATPRGAMPGMVALDDDFTDAAIKRALVAEFPIVHLASHFVFRPGTDEDSFLLLGDGKRLSLRQLKDDDYDFRHVDLLTLSACETAVGGGRDGDGREVEGLGTLAQRQGAKGVLATLWPVADEGTAAFMAELYRARGEDRLSKAEALRRAQLLLLQGKNGRYAHPFFWSPFILMGNWR